MTAVERLWRPFVVILATLVFVGVLVAHLVRRWEWLPVTLPVLFAAGALALGLACVPKIPERFRWARSAIAVSSLFVALSLSFGGFIILYDFLIEGTRDRTALTCIMRESKWILPLGILGTWVLWGGVTALYTRKKIGAILLGYRSGRPGPQRSLPPLLHPHEYIQLLVRNRLLQGTLFSFTLSLLIGVLPVFFLPGFVAGHVLWGGTCVSVKIIEPIDGSTIPAGDLSVEARIKHFNVVDKIGEAPAQRQGHLIFYLDIPAVPRDPGATAIPKAGEYVSVVTGKQEGQDAAVAKHAWTGIKPGKHRFAVQVVNNDDTVLKDRHRTFAEVSVTVK